MHEMTHTLYETLLSYIVQAVHVHASINCAACLSEIDLPLNVELVSGEWRAYSSNVNRITLIIATSDDSASDMHLNRLLEFVFNTMVGTKIFQCM